MLVGQPQCACELRPLPCLQIYALNSYSPALYWWGVLENSTLILSRATLQLLRRRDLCFVFNKFYILLIKQLQLFHLHIYFIFCFIVIINHSMKLFLVRPKKVY
jgi:hypothetical protein